MGNDTNVARDIFLKDTQSPFTVTRISTDSAGTETDGDSYNPSISADGRWVVFESVATNLDGSSSSFRDVYVKDTQPPFTVTRISTDSLDALANNDSYLSASPGAP